MSDYEGSASIIDGSLAISGPAAAASRTGRCIDAGTYGPVDHRTHGAPSYPRAPKSTSAFPSARWTPDTF
jgi:hypothetical protein